LTQIASYAVWCGFPLLSNNKNKIKMRSIFIALLAVAICGNVVARQKTNIPAAAKSAFSKSYAGATKIKWEQEDGQYEVHFNYKKQEMSVLYNAAGTVVETETGIPVASLPAAAQKYASAKGKIKEASKIVSAAGSVQYEAEVGQKDLIFDEKGNFLKEKVEKDDKD
jgi:hypothetical protein